MVTLGALVAAPYALPASVAGRYRLLSPLGPDQAFVKTMPPAPSATVGEAELTFETDDRAPEPMPEKLEIPPAAASILPTGTKPPRPVEDAPEGAPASAPRALDAFYASLAKVERKDPGAIARVSYYGDSIVASDFVTATLRRKLQARFGDAGHGFMLIANPWMGYAHRDVVREAVPGWRVSRVTGPFSKDGLYGLGGVSFRAEGAGLYSRFATTKEGKYGRAVSRFVLDYLEWPEGGVLEVKVDGEARGDVDTKGPEPRSKLAVFEVPDGPHEITFRVKTAGVRAFGVWMERTEPGVVVDALGIQGARIRFLDKSDDAHWAEQLRLRAPSLVAFQFGMNESEDGELFPLVEVESTMRAVVKQVRAALPASSCLVVGPMDRADKRDGVFSSRPVIPKLVAIQRRVALEEGCGFWDTYAAMGGRGSMGNWVTRGLGGADLAHPSSVGAEVLGGWLYEALAQGYEEFGRRAAAPK